MQEKKGKEREEEEDEEEKRPKQQFDKDFILEPFEGVTPEYMEMGEFPASFLNTTITHFLLSTLTPAPCVNIHSDPVRICDPICGLLTSGTSICSTEQCH